MVVSYLVIAEVRLRRVDRFWDEGEPLEGPGPAQDQQANQSRGFVHPVARVCSSVRCETLNRCEANALRQHLSSHSGGADLCFVCRASTHSHGKAGKQTRTRAKFCCSVLGPDSQVTHSAIKVFLEHQ